MGRNNRPALQAKKEGAAEKRGAGFLPGIFAPLPWKKRLLLWLALLASIAAYSNTFRNPFLYGDDENIVARNRYLSDWHYVPDMFKGSLWAGSGAVCNFYRPFQTLLYSVNVHAFGRESVIPYHAENILLNGGAGVLLSHLAFIAAPEGGVLLPALLGSAWAINPLHVEEIAQPTGTQSPMHAFFILLGVLCCALAAKRNAEHAPGGMRFAALYWLACACAMLSKESGIMAPALALLFHASLVKAGKLPRGKMAALHAPAFAIAAAYAILRLTALNFANTLDFSTAHNVFTDNLSCRIYTLFSVLGEGAFKFFLPFGLCPERDWPAYASPWHWRVMVPAAAILIAVWYSARSWKKGNPYWALPTCWFLLAYAPMSNLAAKINALFWDHWFYVPSMAFALGAAGLAAKYRKAATGAALLACLTFAPVTFYRNSYWGEHEKYYRYIIARSPNSAKSWNNLAITLDTAGRRAEAIDAYRRAIVLSDEYPQTHHNLALALLAQGSTAEAEREFSRAIAMKEDFYYSRVELAQLCFARGDYDGALAQLLKVREIYPALPNLDASIAQVEAARAKTRR